MKAPERIETARLLLRRPTSADAEAIFTGYTGDAEVARYLSWPRHESIDATHAFLAYSDAQWKRWPAGPYLIESGRDGCVIGGTGLSFETPFRAATGYVLSRGAWGLGYATEALTAMVALGRDLGLRRLYALCHPENVVSIRVLDKCGFVREGLLPRHSEFPNLRVNGPADTLRFARAFRMT